MDARRKKMERTMGITEENQEELNGFQLYLDELEGITTVILT